MCRRHGFLSALGVVATVLFSAQADGHTHPGRGGANAAVSVMRVVCPEPGGQGTGFLHKSGNVITAAHVVKDCKKEPVLILAGGRQVEAPRSAVDERIDLARLIPREPLKLDSFPIAVDGGAEIGAQVAAWGFPGGYFGPVPLLSVGYISGVEPPTAQTPRRWIINGAFNQGNSGGPLLDPSKENAEVLGVVVAKLAPMPADLAAALNALNARPMAAVFFMYQAPDGRVVQTTQSQMIGRLLRHLQDQVQLVLGMAVHSQTLREFLKGSGVEP